MIEIDDLGKWTATLLAVALLCLPVIDYALATFKAAQRAPSWRSSPGSDDRGGKGDSDVGV